jgi:hypothetical protein
MQHRILSAGLGVVLVVTQYIPRRWSLNSEQNDRADEDQPAGDHLSDTQRQPTAFLFRELRDTHEARLKGNIALVVVLSAS